MKERGGMPADTGGTCWAPLAFEIGGRREGEKKKRGGAMRFLMWGRGEEKGLDHFCQLIGPKKKKKEGEKGRPLSHPLKKGGNDPPWVLELEEETNREEKGRKRLGGS